MSRLREGATVKLLVCGGVAAVKGGEFDDFCAVLSRSMFDWACSVDTCSLLLSCLLSAGRVIGCTSVFVRSTVLLSGVVAGGSFAFSVLDAR